MALGRGRHTCAAAAALGVQCLLEGNPFAQAASAANASARRLHLSILARIDSLKMFRAATTDED